MLQRLHQAEMALRHGDRLVTLDRAKNLACRRPSSRQRRPRDAARSPTRFSTTPAISTPGRCRAKPRATAAALCEWPETSRISSTGRPNRAARSAPAPVAPSGPATPSNSPIEDFDDQKIGRRRGIIRDHAELRGRHRPAVEIMARPSGRRFMEGRVDIIRARFRRPDGDPAPPRRRQQRQRQRGFSAARTRRADRSGRARSSLPSVAVTRAAAVPILGAMEPTPKLRHGWTTGACATAAAKAAYAALLTGNFPDPVEIILPGGQNAAFALAEWRAGEKPRHRRHRQGCGRRPRCDPWRAGPRAGPAAAQPAAGVRFRAGPGVGTVTRPGLPMPAGRARDQPGATADDPRRHRRARRAHRRPAMSMVEISIPGGERSAHNAP